MEGETTQWPKEKGQTMIYKTIHIKLKIEQHEPHQHRQCCGKVSNTNPTNTGSVAGKAGSYCSTINVKGKSFKGKVRKIIFA
jgi:hypothetical protein